MAIPFNMAMLQYNCSLASAYQDRMVVSEHPYLCITEYSFTGIALAKSGNPHQTRGEAVISSTCDIMLVDIQVEFVIVCNNGHQIALHQTHIDGWASPTLQWLVISITLNSVKTVVSILVNDEEIGNDSA